MPAEVFVGVDVGGGGIRVRATVHGRHPRAEDRGPVPRASGHVDAPALAARIGALLATVDGAAKADRIAVGLTGMPGLLESPADLAAHLHRHVDARSVIIAGDLLTTHLGALGGRAGCVVAAGTGVIVLGTDHAGVWHRADGWGYLLGDHGSGAWIGRQGIAAALRAHDGRDGGSAALHRRVRERFGHPDETVRAIYGADFPAHELAAFAPDVAAAAREGDPVAHQIWVRAGAHLAGAAHAAARGLPPTFSWGGRLFDAGELLQAPFQEELTRRVPDAEISKPQGEAADGALLLARRGLPPDGAGQGRYAREFPRPR
jgi:N-acetylglucosamine kinase-like BadF-type ATPase